MKYLMIPLKTRGALAAEVRDLTRSGEMYVLPILATETLELGQAQIEERFWYFRGSYRDGPPIIRRFDTREEAEAFARDSRYQGHVEEVR